MLKTIIKIRKKKKIITWTLMWLNWSETTLNVTLKILVIYKLLLFYYYYLFEFDKSYMRVNLLK